MATYIPQKVDDAAFTPATDKVVPIGALADEAGPDSVDEGDIGIPRMSLNRALHIHIRDAAGNERGLNVDASGKVSVDDVAKLGGAAVPIGAGTEAAAIRVTLPTDGTGKVNVAAAVGSPVFVTPTPSTTGGWTPYSNTALTSTAVSVKAAAGTFGGYMIYNPNAAVIYVQVFDILVGSVSVGASTPVYVISIPGGAAANLEIGNGVNHSTAIVIAATTTPTGSTAPTTALTAAIWYK